MFNIQFKAEIKLPLKYYHDYLYANSLWHWHNWLPAQMGILLKKMDW